MSCTHIMEVYAKYNDMKRVRISNTSKINKCHDIGRNMTSLKGLESRWWAKATYSMYKL